MRPINEEDVLEIIERVTNEAVEKKQPKYLIQKRIIAEIAGLPTIEAEPMKRGRWLDNPNQSQLYSYICSNCRNSCDWTYRYCPNCGSKNKDGDNE